MFPFQPVSISPWQKNASLERELVVPNGSEDHDCDPMRVVAPYLDGTRVYTRFEAICEIPGPEEEMKDTKWTIKLRLKSPTGGRQTTHEYEIGKNVTFDESNTITSLACKPGEWQARAEFWVKLKHEWKGTRIYFNNRYTDITCP